MKKFIVLGVLFILPIVAYMFFASGVNNFAKLPVLTEKIDDVKGLKSLSGEDISLSEKITVLGFLGSDVNKRKGNAFNLNQKIYKRFNGFDDFQFVMVLPDRSEQNADSLKQELSSLANVNNWKFVFTTEFEVKKIFNSLNSSYTLDENLSSPYVFIIDKDKNLRGRDDNDPEGVMYGYDATSVAELNNKMIDDIKVILAEYRLELKKYKGVSKRDSYLKKYNKNEE
ncbi:hypothetical protein [Abyssalbus ytuae]|uniref:Uncharacterized protein n=1 Tax=Abyssalbus ytuae TaxID=2926907 RepID=A0A9E6ZR09_9FLAO|nr:hypothetical protein [Abyssalbus ytuae]UOB18975.1 hypothetical protein MQE35_06680 [Abyssalbus ytuae]